MTLAGTGAAVATHAAQPDAELIALCADFDAMERRIDALSDNDEIGLDLKAADAAAVPIEVEMPRLLDRTYGLTPATMGGCMDVARSLALLVPDYAEDWPSVTMDMGMAAMLLRGVMGRASA